MIAGLLAPTVRSKPPQPGPEAENTEQEEATMAICMIIENPDQGEEQTERVVPHGRSTGPVPPDGARLLLGGPANTGWRFISVWDSHEALDRFYAERLTPAYDHAGLSVDKVDRTLFEVNTLVAGDLTGVPQPA
jgi:hypothetical protein